MSQTITITLQIPDGISASIEGVEVGAAVTEAAGRGPVEEYFSEYLSQSGRRLFAAAARVEQQHGSGFTFEDVAAELGDPYESAKSYHRNSGRTAARWEREKGSAAPIRLDFDGNYGPQEGADGWRSRYELPPGVAEKIVALGAEE
jgi:hypothetical protein